MKNVHSGHREKHDNNSSEANSNRSKRSNHDIKSNGTALITRNINNSDIIRDGTNIFVVAAGRTAIPQTITDQNEHTHNNRNGNTNNLQ